MPQLALLGIPLGLTLVAVVTDLRRREVPDAVPLALLSWAVAARALGWTEIGWFALVAGLVLGLATSAIFYALGALGGGDVKLLAALGAVLGPVALASVLFWMALAGGALALVSAIRGEREFAYVPAIAVGLCVQLAWPNAIESLFLRQV
jgi:prepilin peptidase CpaA